MASEVGICNMAVSHIGEDAVVVAITPPDGSAISGHCARFYGIARNDILELHEWSFATARSTLAVVTNDSTAWAYKLALPADCLKVRKLLPEGATREDLTITYDIESGFLYCNDAVPMLVYTKLVTDTTKFSSMMTSAVSYKLASYIAGPITKKAATVANMLEVAISTAAKAAQLDANAAVSEVHDTPAAWLTQRGGRSPYAEEGFVQR